MSTPCIVFLDEPTSGLDSFAALNVMAYMRGMATKFSQTVISSIHQPRAAIWQLFDRVRGGGVERECVLRVQAKGVLEHRVKASTNCVHLAPWATQGFQHKGVWVRSLPVAGATRPLPPIHQPAAYLTH
jgi:ABC-type Mn2+/Zn2+ transport system ATPase subunit